MDYAYEITKENYYIEIPGYGDINEVLWEFGYVSLYDNTNKELVYPMKFDYRPIEELPTVDVNLHNIYTIYPICNTLYSSINIYILSYSTVSANPINKWLDIYLYVGYNIGTKLIKSTNYIHVKRCPSDSYDILQFYYKYIISNNNLDTAKYIIWILNSDTLTYDQIKNAPLSSISSEIYYHERKLSVYQSFTFKYINEQYYLIRSSLPMYYLDNNEVKLITANNYIPLQMLIDNKFGKLIYIDAINNINTSQYPSSGQTLLNVTEDIILSKIYKSYRNPYNPDMKSAFIRICTPELISKLTSLGYTGEEPTEYGLEGQCIATSIMTETERSYSIIPEELFDNPNLRITWNINGRIDCGTDIEKFLSLI